jgi:hypothetical protein
LKQMKEEGAKKEEGKGEGKKVHKI